MNTTNSTNSNPEIIRSLIASVLCSAELDRAEFRTIHAPGSGFVVVFDDCAVAATPAMAGAK
jgi:hypothetical protein